MRFLPTVSKELSQNSFRYIPTSAASHAIRSSTLPQDLLYLHFNMLINLIREWGSKFSGGLNAPCKVPCLTAPMQDGLNTVILDQPTSKPFFPTGSLHPPSTSIKHLYSSDIVTKPVHTSQFKPDTEENLVFPNTQTLRTNRFKVRQGPPRHSLPSSLLPLGSQQ